MPKLQHPTSTETVVDVPARRAEVLRSRGYINIGESPSDVPAQSAPKGEWVDYAVAQGADRDEADDMTKADLVEQYGD